MIEWVVRRAVSATRHCVAIFELGDKPDVPTTTHDGLDRTLKRKLAVNSLKTLVGAGRFELPTPCSRSKCATRLRYAPPNGDGPYWSTDIIARGGIATRARDTG